jgi:hypothetical protein
MTLSTGNIQQEEAHSGIAMANAAVAGATSGLNSFLLKRDGLSGDSLFRHTFQRHLFDPKVRDHHPSSYLNIEFDINQIGELGPSAKDLTKQCIMSFAGRHGATMKLAKHKLDSLGYIKFFSGVQNDPDRTRRLTNKLERVQSLASIADAEAKESAAHKAAGKAETRLIAPAAKHKFIARGMDVTKLMKNQSFAVLAAYYGKQETDNKKKPILAELLRAEIELNDHLLHTI